MCSSTGMGKVALNLSLHYCVILVDFLEWVIGVLRLAVLNVKDVFKGSG